MDKIKQLQVLYEGRTVGTMALYRKHLAAFQYSEEWIADGFSISPFSLPLGKKVFVPQILPFDGIFGDAGSEPQEAQSPSATIAEPLPAWMRRSQATPPAAFAPLLRAVMA